MNLATSEETVKILLGTRNNGKVTEVKKILNHYDFLTYRDIPFGQVTEDGTNYAENAVKKALCISKETNLPVLAEDSGLEVTALGGKPGIHSSRFAGHKASDGENIKKLLDLLAHLDRREASFKSVAVLYVPERRLILAYGQLRGKIGRKKAGRHGFGYDPVFIPSGYDKKLAQLGPKIKNKISHRKRALVKLRGRLAAYL